MLPPELAWSDGSVAATLAAGSRVNVTIPVVKNQLPADAPNVGTVGIQLAQQPLGGLIANVQRESAADRAGIASGDSIASVDGVALTGLTPGGIDTLIQNHPIGTAIKLGITRGSTTRVVSMTVTPPR